MKVAEQIRQAVAQAISDGVLLPGDPVDEAQLIARYEVSKTPVREALLQLQAQGLVSSLPRGGMVVAKMDMPQLLAMWELLAELEAVCARLACERMTTQERTELAAVHERAGDAVKAEDESAWEGHNRAFHEIIYQGARNPYLRQEILRVRSQTGAYRRHAFSALGLLHNSWSQHAQLLRAFQKRDAKAAADLMVQHMRPGQGLNNLSSLVATMPAKLLDS